MAASGRKSALTQTRIMDAAASVLGRRGYAGTRLTDVAREAGLQPPAIYYYFDSREALVEAVMVAGVRQMREHLETVLDALDAGTDALGRLLLAVEEHLRHELDISDYMTASIRNAGQVPPSIQEAKRAEDLRYGRLWRTLVHDALPPGRREVERDVLFTQMLVLGALNWTAEWWDDERADLDALVVHARGFVRAAIEGPAPALTGPGPGATGDAAPG